MMNWQLEGEDSKCYEVEERRGAAALSRNSLRRPLEKIQGCLIYNKSLIQLGE
jgi:hypothetical protein